MSAHNDAQARLYAADSRPSFSLSNPVIPAKAGIQTANAVGTSASLTRVLARRILQRRQNRAANVKGSVMSPEIIAMLIMGVALAAIILVQMIFSELNRTNKRIDRLEGICANCMGESFERPTESVEERVAYLEGLMKGRAGKKPS